MVKSFKLFNKVIMVAVTLVVIGMLLPEKLIIPVEGASSKDWNHDTFWYEPWGTSGLKGDATLFQASFFQASFVGRPCRR